MMLSKVSESDENTHCPSCGGEWVCRPLAPYPVLTQILFGFGFLALIIVDQSRIQIPSWIYWLWTGVQMILGALLIRGRLRARKKIYRCVQCRATVG